MEETDASAVTYFITQALLTIRIRRPRFDPDDWTTTQRGSRLWVVNIKTRQAFQICVEEVSPDNIPT